MPAAARPTKPKKIRRLDEIPPGTLRPAASEPLSAPPAEAPPPSAPVADVGDGRVPGTAAHAQLQAEADQLTNVAPGTYLYGALAGYFGSAVDKYSYVVFLQRLVAQMAPADPLEAMLVEQIALSHHALGRAHVRAANATNAEVAKIFFTAAAKLQAEFRQSLLALKGYRAPAHPSGRAAETAKAPPATETRPESRSEGPPLPFDGTELGSNHANRLKEYFDELAAAGA